MVTLPATPEPSNKTTASLPPSLGGSPTSIATRHAGITELPQAPFSQGDFQVSNSWVGPDKSNSKLWYEVYVGGSPTGLGGVRVYTFPASVSESRYSYVGQFLDTGEPKLRILSFSGDTLTLAPAHGTSPHITFDATTNTFS